MSGSTPRVIAGGAMTSTDEDTVQDRRSTMPEFDGRGQVEEALDALGDASAGTRPKGTPRCSI